MRCCSRRCLITSRTGWSGYGRGAAGFLFARAASGADRSPDRSALRLVRASYHSPVRSKANAFNFASVSAASLRPSEHRRSSWDLRSLGAPASQSRASRYFQSHLAIPQRLWPRALSRPLLRTWSATRMRVYVWFSQSCSPFYCFIHPCESWIEIERIGGQSISSSPPIFPAYDPHPIRQPACRFVTRRSVSAAHDWSPR